jgi:hypothetical protein
MQVAAAGPARIDDCTLKPGNRVTVASLARRHGVALPTAARGLRIVVAEGRLTFYPATATPSSPIWPQFPHHPPDGEGSSDD